MKNDKISFVVIQKGVNEIDNTVIYVSIWNSKGSIYSNSQQYHLKMLQVLVAPVQKRSPRRNK